MANDLKNEKEEKEEKENVLSFEDLCIRLSTNINKLRSAMGWNQKEFAEKWEISTGALNNYMNPKPEMLKIPPLDRLLRLCRIQDFAENGLRFGIDDLISETFDPQEVIRWHREASNVSAVKVSRNDYVGNYLCYLNDQTNLSDGLGNKKVRELRFGAMSVFDRIDSVSGKRTMQVYVKFFKPEKRSEAIKVKKELDEIFGSTTIKNDVSLKSNGKRNKEISEYVSKDAGFYSGELLFSGNRGFISIENENFFDKALIVFQVPEKNASNEFIGGIGSMTSVSHGGDRIPVSQKIIMSRYELNCDDLYIADYLNMSFPNFTHDESAKRISEFCSKLYNGSIEGLDESDKIALINARIHKVIIDYIKNNLTCVSGITKEENKRVYRLIQDNIRLI